MYIKEIMYGISCDGCETIYEDFNGWTLHTKKEEAKDAALESNTGWIEHDEKHYCPNCHLIDDNDNTVVRKSKETLIP
ncbi:hypothetical protein [Dysgonomonas sp. HGC4]|uniref:hypothetical protein n=1 Tax=Dysgonomonas sp. HGC4 TaxID=1658009 RepID=UPI0006819EEF|nr:hypothetical protein [Dysgonomonas sp. HGC4]MBD8348555.1 hypothetical protein [Dysgonomonas sp. HGC4]